VNFEKSLYLIPAETGYLMDTIIPKRLNAIAIIVIKTIKPELSFST
jgi:hypothetical protein